MPMSRRAFHQLLLLGSAGKLLPVSRSGLLLAEDAALPLQPFAAAVKRVVSALAAIGTPLAASEMSLLDHAYAPPVAGDGIAQIQQVLDSHVLLTARMNPEGRVSVTRGLAKAELIQNGWQSFLVKVENEAGETSAFTMYSEQAEPMGRMADNSIMASHDSTNGAVDAIIAESRWLALDNWAKPPLQSALSGLGIEYRILLLYSRDAGKREASLEALTGGKEQDLGYRSTLPILFNCLPSHQVRLQIKDADGRPAMASLLIRDTLARVYPVQGKRTLPDLWFEPHIYRRDGETICLPAGDYSIECGRGPEYLKKTHALSVSDGAAQTLAVKLDRWIDPKEFGYYSGDTHIHAAGCSHYDSPAEGVTPEVMYRQVQGEALDVGDVLTWGPGYFYQKQFFRGRVEQHTSSADEKLATMRYDVEVSGFPSSHCGHLVLLGLSEQDYPGTTSLDQWPSWNVPILSWAKQQKALAGYAHSGHGLTVNSTELPNYIMPPFDSMGANEYIVDVTHEGLVAFISGCDTRPFAELNIWYHTLNCGFRTAFVGETDFPCLSDERVGGGRTYVQLDVAPDGDRGYADWLAGIVSMRSYSGDGRSHIFNFTIASSGGLFEARELNLHEPANVQVSSTVCARLDAEINQQTEQIRTTSPYDKPYWHLERARIKGSRKVALELIVNGIAVQQQEIPADGSHQPVAFELHVTQSCWVALRVLPSSHTNPLFVRVNGAPVRASRRSAQWCRTAVDVCWAQKSPRIRPAEIVAAKTAYDHARATYDQILAETRSE